ncbi:MAG TPA: hypothetical protein VJ889_08640, partial [Pseudomonas sp.]|nr:hypothetical protein [Pseudomonas sp.]
MAADYTHFIHPQQEPSEVCVGRTCGHNDGLEFSPDSEGSPVSQSLIAALQNPALYPHPVEGFQVIETHISWVLLTGP